MKPITKRLLPGQDLKAEIERLVSEHHITAGTLTSVVGSLSKLTLRIADGKTVMTWDKEFEIVSGTGTLSIDGCHLHISASDNEGKTIGGHLKSGCIINTTAEIVLISFEGVQYRRLPDEKTGYDELSVE